MLRIDAGSWAMSAFSFSLKHEWLANVGCRTSHRGFEWVLKALSCERMQTAYQGISLRLEIMGLLKLHNCILLFLSFTFASVLRLIPCSPSDESCFPFLWFLFLPLHSELDLLSLCKSIWFQLKTWGQRAMEGELWEGKTDWGKKMKKK